MRSQAHCRVSAAVLVTLTGYVDWVPMSHIMMNNAILLQSLCALLSVETLQLQAAECLLLIVSRKVTNRLNAVDKKLSVRISIILKLIFLADDTYLLLSAVVEYFVNDNRDQLIVEQDIIKKILIPERF